MFSRGTQPLSNKTNGPSFCGRKHGRSRPTDRDGHHGGGGTDDCARESADRHGKAERGPGLAIQQCLGVPVRLPGRRTLDRFADEFTTERANIFPLTETISSSFHHFFCGPPVSVFETSSRHCLWTGSLCSIPPHYNPGLVENASTPARSSILLGVIGLPLILWTPSRHNCQWEVCDGQWVVHH